MKASIETIKTHFNEEEITISAQKIFKKILRIPWVLLKQGVEIFRKMEIPHIRMDRN